MAKPDPDKPLYDALGFESRARFWRSLLSSDLGSKSGLDPEDVQLERRLVLYRLMLVIMLVACGTVLLGGLLETDTPTSLLAFAGLSCLCLAAATVQVYLKNSTFLPPIMALALTIIGVIWSVGVGAEQQQLWLFPLNRHPLIPQTTRQSTAGCLFHMEEIAGLWSYNLTKYRKTHYAIPKGSTGKTVFLGRASD